MAKDEDEKAHDEEHEPHDDEAEDEESDDGADEEESDEEAEGAESSGKVAPVPKPAPKPASLPKAAPPVRPQPVRAAEPPPPPPPAMGKRLAVFAAVLVTLTAGFYVLPASDTLAPGAAKWKVGQLIDADITLVKEDAVKLACGSPTAIAGRKCEYSNKTDKNDDIDDQHMLKPYTTVDQVQFLAAGLWSQIPKDKLPAERFSVHCKYHVEGTIKNPLIRWDPKAAWGEKNPDWNAGYLSDCKLNTPQ
jgi:hypothetical protein